jgi:hypothetical protein
MPTTSDGAHPPLPLWKSRHKADGINVRRLCNLVPLFDVPGYPAGDLLADEEAETLKSTTPLLLARVPGELYIQTNVA